MGFRGRRPGTASAPSEHPRTVNQGRYSGGAPPPECPPVPAWGCKVLLPEVRVQMSGQRPDLPLCWAPRPAGGGVTPAQTCAHPPLAGLLPVSHAGSASVTQEARCAIRIPRSSRRRAALALPTAAQTSLTPSGKPPRPPYPHAPGSRSGEGPEGEGCDFAGLPGSGARTNQRVGVRKPAPVNPPEGWLGSCPLAAREISPAAPPV